MIVGIDDKLIQEALMYSDSHVSPNELINEAISTVIRLRALKKLAALGGAAPKMRDIPR